MKKIIYDSAADFEIISGLCLKVMITYNFGYFTRFLVQCHVLFYAHIYVVSIKRIYKFKDTETKMFGGLPVSETLDLGILKFKAYSIVEF